MLVLSGKKNERFMIGDDVVVQVLGINGGQVRLGFDAPREIPIHREEIYNKIQEEKE